MKKTTSVQKLLFLGILHLAFFAIGAVAGGGHGGLWEFAAVYDLHESAEHGNYSMFFSKVNKKYADDFCKILIMTTTKSTTDGIETQEEAAETIWEGGNTSVTANQFGTKLYTDVLYKLNFDSTVPQAGYNFPHVPNDQNFVVFFQHFPSEFDFQLMDSEGTVYEPTATEPGSKKKAEAHYEGDVGLGMLACFIVAFCTLIGLLAVPPCFANSEIMKNTEFMMSSSAAFAAGALIGCSLLIILPECVRLIDGAWGFKDEAGNNFYFGIATFLGLAVNIPIHWAWATKEDAPAADGKLPVTASTVVVKPPKSQGWSVNYKNWGNIVGSVLLGDFLHNFADGVAVMIAFKTCDKSLGWAVMAGAVAHEIPQELADFFVLRENGNMSTFEALFFNFISGLSCIIGGAIVAAVEVDNVGKVFILAFAAGAYVWIGCVECLPKMINVRTLKDKIIHVVVFLCGFFVIAFVLTFHTHCEAVASAGDGGGGGDAHAHHGHGH